MERHERLRIARREAGFSSAAEAARRLGVPTGTYGGHEAGTRGIGPDEIARYAAAFRVSASWLAFEIGAMPEAGQSQKQEKQQPSEPPSDYEPAPEAPAFHRLTARGNMVPVLGIAIGGKDESDFHMNGETVNFVPRPPGLVSAKDVYALYTANDSMYPRFSPGDVIYVNPHQVPAIGDDVVIELVPDTEGDAAGPGYLKRLRHRTPTKIVVEQFNPPREIEFARDEIKLLHRVVTWQEALGL